MKRINHTMAIGLAGILGLAVFNGCGPRQPTVTVKAFIDGSDVVNVSGNVWSPKWNDKVSDAFEGLSPAFRPHAPPKIQITKRAGRGTVSIAQFPTSDNDHALAVRMDDGDFGGADWYEFVISWR